MIETNKKFQILWGCYYRQLQKSDNPAHNADAANMLYLLKYAYDKYGYFIDLTDLPDPNVTRNTKKELYLKEDYGDFAGLKLEAYIKPKLRCCPKLHSQD